MEPSPLQTEPETPGDFDYEAALAACAAGDRVAFRRLYEQEAPRLLGVALRIVRIADPQALADASLELLSDPELWAQTSQSGIARVEKYYAQHMLFDRYRALYDQGFAWQA